MKYFDTRRVTVFVEDGKHMILTPEGETIPGVMVTEVKDEVNYKNNESIETQTTVGVVMHCNLCGSKEEALEKYGAKNKVTSPKSVFRNDYGNIKYKK